MTIMPTLFVLPNLGLTFESEILRRLEFILKKVKFIKPDWVLYWFSREEEVEWSLKPSLRQ